MVPFAGYELPVLYKGENGGVMKEHLWCRADGKAAMFDVSHMGQVGPIKFATTTTTKTPSDGCSSEGCLYFLSREFFFFFVFH